MMALVDARTWIALIVVSALGFGAGWRTKSAFADAAQVTQARLERAATGAAVVAAVVASAKTETGIATSAEQVRQIQSAVRRRGVTLVASSIDLPHQESLNGHHACAVPAAIAAVCGDRLDVGTVGLLRAAREGANVDSVADSDAALAAASTVTLSAFVDNDLEIIRLYRALALRHDQLVDDVERQLIQQAQ